MRCNTYKQSPRLRKNRVNKTKTESGEGVVCEGEEDTSPTFTSRVRDLGKSLLETEEMIVNEVGRHIRETEKSFKHNAMELGRHIMEKEEQIVHEVKEFGHRLLQMHELPEWGFDNEFILKYYRQPNHGVLHALQSMFYLHNEFFNIWTHFAGAIILCVLGYFALERLENRAYQGEITTWIIFLASALTCMMASTSYHLLRQTSPAIYRATIIVDYLGIAFLIFGSFVSAMFYIFFCHPEALRLYTGIIFFLCAGTKPVLCHIESQMNLYSYRCYNSPSHIR